MSSKKSQRQKLESQMARAGFWDNPDSAQSVVSQLRALKSVIEPVEEIQREVKDLQELFELAAAESDQGELGQLEDDLGEPAEKHPHCHGEHAQAPVKSERGGYDA